MAVEVKIPVIGESISEVTLSEWLVEDGAYVTKDDFIAELESDKATLELPVEESGIITFTVEEGADVEIGGVVATIDTSAKAPAAAPKKEAAPVAKEEPKPEPKKEEAAKPAETKAPAKEETYASGHPSPAAAKLMAENGLTSKVISGSGKDGRITQNDVVQALKNGAADLSNVQEIVSGNYSREVRREKMSRLRKTIASHLLNAKNGTAMLTTFNEVDMTAILDIRKQYKEKFREEKGVNLGFMSFFTRACTLALQEVQGVNAQLDGDHVIYHDFCDIGVAVSTPKGLVVPVIRNAESMSFSEIEGKIKELAIKGRDSKLTMADMEGGTFTISNGGVFGSLMSTPILNAPQSAILGMHKIQERPMAIDGKVEIRPMMYLAMSYDHRIIDGKEAVTFLVRVKERLEDPAQMLLGKDPVQALIGL